MYKLSTDGDTVVMF